MRVSMFIISILIGFNLFGQSNTLSCIDKPFEFKELSCGGSIDLAGDISAIYANESCQGGYEASNISQVEIVNDGGQQEASGTTIYNELNPSTIVPMDSVVRALFDNGSPVFLEDMLEYMMEIPYYQQNVFNLNWGRYFDIVFIYRVDYFTTSGQSNNGGPAWSEDDAIIRIRYRIRHGKHIVKKTSFNSACVGKKYAISDMFEPLPSFFSNYEVTASTPTSYNLTNDSLSFLYDAALNTVVKITANDVLGHEICRTWTIPLGEVKNAWFTDVIQSSGVITSASSSVNMSNYIDSTGGIMEYSGSGLVVNGPFTNFDPSFASSGENIMYVRSNNSGCLSDWHDTIFYVTPTVLNFDAPIWDVGYTFNGDLGGTLTKNVTGVVENVGKYHMGCSNTTYSLKPQNHLQGLELEYKVLWKNQIIDNGIIQEGQSIDLVMPDSIDYNLSSSIYDASALYFPGSSQVTYNLLFTTSAGDLNNNGSLDSDDFVASVTLGDEYRVIGRYINVLNQMSDYVPFVIGLVKTPETNANALLCFDGNPILNGVSSTPVYHDSVDINKYRSAIWDVEMDGVYDVDGSVDNYVYQLNNVVKEYTMTSRIIDSTYLWMYSPYLNDYINIYKENVSTVCYSSLDTISVVRNPIPSYTFNLQGVQGVGTAIYSDVVGDWMDLVSDSITWDWSDGSLLYEGASNWHFLNDLGNYTLTARVEDGYGCYTTNLFYNNWFVPGVLELDENNQEYLEIYPIPVVDELTIKGFRGGEVVTIYDTYGKVVYVGVEHIINMSMFSSGVYVIHIENDGLIVKRKIVKL